MANNKLYLRVKETGEQILLSEYYPNTGWYCFHSQKVIDDWFDENINEDRSPYGNTDLELVYEDKN